MTLRFASVQPCYLKPRHPPLEGSQLSALTPRTHCLRTLVVHSCQHSHNAIITTPLAPIITWSNNPESSTHLGFVKCSLSLQCLITATWCAHSLGLCLHHTQSWHRKLFPHPWLGSLFITQNYPSFVYSSSQQLHNGSPSFREPSLSDQTFLAVETCQWNGCPDHQGHIPWGS